MLNQNSYGRMEVPLDPQKGGPYSVPCARCKAVFLLEKNHHEVFMQDMFWGRQKDGTLAPANPKNVEYHRLCTACYTKLKEWITA